MSMFSTVANAGFFLYFAYGSNLLASRIHVNNPSAVRAGPAKLLNYRLDFIGQSRTWKGSPATIVELNGSYVWGALWKIDNVHMESLDRQEGVQSNVYKVLKVKVWLMNGTFVEARTYQQTRTPDELTDIENLPEDRRPSVAYLNTILKGAEETGLPEDYQQWLRLIPDNGYDGKVDLNS